MDESTENTAQHAPHEEAHKDAKAETNTLMGILAYIGPLILVSFLLAKDDPFVKFHIKQGLLLIIAEVASYMAVMLFWPLFLIVQIVNIVIFVLAVVGVIRAAQGQMKELPLIGHLAKNFNF